MSLTITINETEATITVAETVVAIGGGGAGTGDVTGPSSSVNSEIALFSGTTGKIIKASGGKLLPTGTVVGTSDSQTLTNKTITNPIFDSYADFTEMADPSNPGSTVGRVFASDTNGKTNLAMLTSDGLKMRIGRDIIHTVRNTSGSTLTKGTVVYITGSTGTTPNVAAAKADSRSTMPAMGILMEDISNNAYGRMQRLGRTEYTLDTSAWSVGTELFVSASSAGQLTSTEPAHPYYPQAVAVVVVSHATQGSLFANFASYYNGHSSGTAEDTFIIGASTATSLKIAKSSSGGQKTATFPNQDITVAGISDAIANGETVLAPTQNVVYDALALKAADSAVVHNTGDETIAGIKTFSSTPLVPDDAYDATGWNANTGVPNKNAIRDKIEALPSESQTLTNKTLTDAVNNISSPGTTTVGYLGIPQQSKSANYTTIMSDAGKHIYHPSTDANARTFTIDSNANVAYPIGTTLTFINETSQVVTIAITSDTLVLAGTGSTGSRSLAQYGMATAVKVTSTRWYINGSGLT